MSVVAYKDNDPSAPSFPKEFEVVKKAVLQVTDLKNNNNKYYAIELHSAKKKFRVFTHYGRTDDLNSNPNAGMRENRFFDSADEAEKIYGKIYAEKTSPRKGYKEVSLASSKIGSSKSVGSSSGEIDAKTIAKLAEKAPKVASTFVLARPVQELVADLYAVATNALTSTLNVNITANGIETPLGVLTLGQIEKGQDVLNKLIVETHKKVKKHDELSALTGDFYTLIPHRLGRTREAIEASIIDTAAKCKEKEETLQLMRDMLNVNGDPSVLMNSEIEGKYKALGCEIELLEGSRFQEIQKHLKDSLRKRSSITVKTIYAIKRKGEVERFDTKVGNEKLLFHGSSPKNWVGILSRGLLLPKTVVTLGVHRTDAGWLGNGIYFGSEACTAMGYAGYGMTGKRNSRFLTVANVALGKSKVYTKITYGIDAAPAGFDSCHGKPGGGSQFADNEFVVYRQEQQRLDYLVEFS
jgi:poly [ADP-ribose] polymerase